MNWLLMFLYCLILTELIELPVAWVLGVRSFKGLSIVATVNLLTNPAAVFLSWISILWFGKQILIVDLTIEIVIIIVEMLVYRLFGKEDDFRKDFHHPIKLSVITNVLSYSLGLILACML